MRTLPIILAVLLAVVVAPVAASAQTPAQRADLTASVGSYSAYQREAERYDRWGHSALGSLRAGYYWTDHLKTEVEIAWTGEREAYGSQSGRSDVDPYGYVYVRHGYRNTVFSAAQAWQFGRNAFFHPFVSAGVDVDRERHVADRPAQHVPLSPAASGPTRVAAALVLTETDVRARLYGAAGFKGYFSERTFFRTELKLGVGNRLDQVTWKAGVGIDF